MFGRKLFLFLFFVFRKISSNMLRDGDTMNVNLEGDGKSEIDLLIDGQSIEIPLDKLKKISQEPFNRQEIPDEVKEDIVKTQTYIKRFKDEGISPLSLIAKDVKKKKDILVAQGMPASAALKFIENQKKKMPRFLFQEFSSKIRTEAEKLKNFIYQAERKQNFGFLMKKIVSKEDKLEGYLKDQLSIISQDVATRQNHIYSRGINQMIIKIRSLFKTMRGDYSEDSPQYKKYTNNLKDIKKVLKKLEDN